MHVIGTAGHVDHGKSTLVYALTGINPDRLREEQEREMTIDLGFAWITLPNGESVGIVDVPGHRDFIENMLAGVGGIDAALFVVAADEGVMPQTREHLAILDLLGVEHGLIALTKTDLAESEEWIELVMADISETLAGTVLAGAPIVPVSARTGQGLDRLVEVLQNVLASTEPRPDHGRPRLPVDRVFTVSGFGTVVTGTLTGGHFEVGQEVEILPQGLKARVRGLQSHKRESQRAAPGSRVAMNLSGVHKDDIQRGNVVTTPGWLRPTVLVDARLRYLPDAPRALTHNTQVKFFSGAAETLGRLRLLGLEKLEPGQDGWVQIRLQNPIPLVKGDRFIIRIPSPPATVGGGVVVDPHPGRQHRRFRPEVIRRLNTLAQGSPAEILLQTLERSGPTRISDLQPIGSQEDTAEALAQLLTSGEAILLGDPTDGVADVSSGAARRRIVAARSWWEATTSRMMDLLSTYHREFPLRIGVGREALRSGLRLDARVFNALMERVTSDGIVADEGANVRLPSHQIRFTPDQQRRVNALLDRFHRQPYITPSFKECVEAVGEDVLNVLIGRGDLIVVSPTVLFLSSTYQEICQRIREHIEMTGSITLAQTRDMLGTSRKYAQAILEYLDEIGVTRRKGDERVLASRK